MTSKKRCLFILLAACVLAVSSRSIRPAQAGCYAAPVDSAPLTLQSVTVDGVPNMDTSTYDKFTWSITATDTGYQVHIAFGGENVGNEVYAP